MHGKRYDAAWSSREQGQRCRCCPGLVRQRRAMIGSWLGVSCSKQQSIARGMSDGVDDTVLRKKREQCYQVSAPHELVKLVRPQEHAEETSIVLIHMRIPVPVRPGEGSVL